VFVSGGCSFACACSFGDGFVVVVVVEVLVLRCRALLLLVVAGEGRECTMNLLVVLWQQDWSNWMLRLLVHVANVLPLVMSEFILGARS